MTVEWRPYGPDTAADALAIINEHTASWPYSRPVDGALLAHWETLGEALQPAWMRVAYRDGVPRAFFHGEQYNDQLDIHLLAMRPGALEDGITLLADAESRARDAGLARMVGPYYRTGRFYGGYLLGCEPYTPQWALDTVSAYVRRGFRITLHAVVLRADLTAPVEPAPLPDGYTLVETAAGIEFDAVTFRYAALCDGVEAAGSAARFYPNLTSPAGRPIGQVGFVGTAETHRGRGLAKILSQHCLARLRTLGAAESLIATGMENYPALKAYESIGFQRWCMINEWGKEWKR